MKKLINLFFDKTFVKFIIVGVINTLFGTGIMFLFYNVLHFSYWISSASNYFFGSILSYFLNKNVTFNNTEKSAKTIVRFVVGISICYLVAYGVARPIASFFLSDFSSVIKDNVSMLIGMGLFVVLNYISQRFFVFK